MCVFDLVYFSTKLVKSVCGWQEGQGSRDGRGEREAALLLLPSSQHTKDHTMQQPRFSLKSNTKCHRNLNLTNKDMNCHQNTMGINVYKYDHEAPDWVKKLYDKACV